MDPLETEETFPQKSLRRPFRRRPASGTMADRLGLDLSLHLFSIPQAGLFLMLILRAPV
jgi:hypothetical protein